MLQRIVKLYKQYMEHLLYGEINWLNSQIFLGVFILDIKSKHCITQRMQDVLQPGILIPAFFSKNTGRTLSTTVTPSMF